MTSKKRHAEIQLCHNRKVVVMEPEISHSMEVEAIKQGLKILQTKKQPADTLAYYHSCVFFCTLGELSKTAVVLGLSDFYQGKWDDMSDLHALEELGRWTLLRQSPSLRVKSLGLTFISLCASFGRLIELEESH